MNSYQQDYLTALHEKLQELQAENIWLRADLEQAKEIILKLLHYPDELGGYRESQKVHR